MRWVAHAEPSVSCGGLYNTRSTAPSFCCAAEPDQGAGRAQGNPPDTLWSATSAGAPYVRLVVLTA